MKIQLVFCKVCGKSNLDSKKVCTHCGAALPLKPPAPSSKTPQPVSETIETSQPSPPSYAQEEIRALTEFFRKLGFEVTSPKLVRGRSGIEHRFNIFASKDNFSVALDAISAPPAVGPEKVVGFFAKILDTKPTQGVLVAMPKLEEEAQKLGALFNVETIAGEETDKILTRLTQLLEQSTASNKLKPKLEQPAPAITLDTAPKSQLDITNADEIIREARSQIARLLEAEDQISTGL